jgi:hypothetical protein
MRVEKAFIIYLVKETEFSSICILEMNNSNVGWKCIKEQCLIKCTLKTHHFTSKLTLNNTTITAMRRLSCSILTCKWVLNHSSNAPRCCISYSLAADFLIRDLITYLRLNFLKIPYFIFILNVESIFFRGTSGISHGTPKFDDHCFRNPPKLTQKNFIEIRFYNRWTVDKSK